MSDIIVLDRGHMGNILLKFPRRIWSGGSTFTCDGRDLGLRIGLPSCLEKFSSP